MQRFHLNAQIPKDITVSLGSFGIILAELTKGYAIFTNGGKDLRLRHITSIKDRTGKTYPLPTADQDWPVEEKPVEETPVENIEEIVKAGNPFHENLNQTQVYDPRLAYLMTNLLKGVTQYGTAA